MMNSNFDMMNSNFDMLRDFDCCADVLTAQTDHPVRCEGPTHTHILDSPGLGGPRLRL